MSKFRKKPVEIEAIQWIGSNTEAVRSFVGNATEVFSPNVVGGQCLVISTPEGDMIVTPRDWIVQVQGEFSSCKPDIFQATYEAVT